MITPTQAQIEAAAKAIEAATISLKDFSKWSEVAATAALTAAAEADNGNWIAKRADIRASAIERCAQVADSFAQAGFGHAVSIAAAIRALKDQP